MKHEHSPKHSEFNDELPAPFRMAVETILAEPTPEIDLARLIPVVPLVAARRPVRRSWMRRVAGGLLVGAAAAALVAVIVTLRPASAWAQLAEAMRKQEWVHFVMTGPDGQVAGESWFSPVKKVAAARGPGGTMFLDLNENKLERYDEKEKAIYVSQPKALEREVVAFLDRVLQAMAKSADSKTNGGSAFAKLIGQSQREVEEDGKRWTEHVLDFEHPERTPPQSQQLFRVPAGEQLPTRMTQKFEVGGKTVSRWCEIDYPKTGPGDLFAMDVPRDAKVVDLRAGDSLKSLLAGFNKQRAVPLEPFTATVLVAMPDWDWKDIFDARRLRFDRAGLNCEQLMLDMQDLRERIYRKEIRVPDTDRPQWWKNELAGLTGRLSYTYEKANEVINNPLEIGYMPLSGFAADGSFTAGTSRLTFNPKPAFGPTDCLMAISGRLRSCEVKARSHGRSAAVSPEMLNPRCTPGWAASSSSALSRT